MAQGSRARNTAIRVCWRGARIDSLGAARERARDRRRAEDHGRRDPTARIDEHGSGLTRNAERAREEARLVADDRNWESGSEKPLRRIRGYDDDVARIVVARRRDPLEMRGHLLARGAGCVPEDEECLAGARGSKLDRFAAQRPKELPRSWVTEAAQAPGLPQFRDEAVRERERGCKADDQRRGGIAAAINGDDDCGEDAEPEVPENARPSKAPGPKEAETPALERLAAHEAGRNHRGEREQQPERGERRQPVELRDEAGGYREFGSGHENCERRRQRLRHPKPPNGRPELVLVGQLRAGGGREDDCEHHACGENSNRLYHVSNGGLRERR
jgi:hypothetical protein